MLFLNRGEIYQSEFPTPNRKQTENVVSKIKIEKMYNKTQSTTFQSLSKDKPNLLSVIILHAWVDHISVIVLYVLECVI